MNALGRQLTNVRKRVLPAHLNVQLRPAGDVSVTHVPEANVRMHTLVQEADWLGGDLIDLRRSTDRALGVTLADVTGHGMEAAPYAARVRDVLASLDESNRNAPTWLGALNDRLCDRLGDERLCCAISAKLRWSAPKGTLEASLVIAGMPMPLVYRAATGTVEHVGTFALPFGVEPQSTHLPRPAGCVLRPGDLLVLFSDGVTEAGTPRQGMLGAPRVESIVRSLAPAGGRAVVEGLAAAVRRMQRHQTDRDDFTIAVIASAEQRTQTQAA